MVGLRRRRVRRVHAWRRSRPARRCAGSPRPKSRSPASRARCGRAAPRAAPSTASRPRRCAGACGPTSLFLGRISANVEARIPDGFVSGNVIGLAEQRAVQRSARRDLIAGARRRAARARHARPGQRCARVARSRGRLARRLPSASSSSRGLESLPLIPDGSGAYVPLGDYTVTFVPAPEGELAATFVDNGGPLEVEGTVEPRCGARLYARRARRAARRRSRDARRGAEDHDGRARCRGAPAPQLDAARCNGRGPRAQLAEQRKVQAELHGARVASRQRRPHNARAAARSARPRSREMRARSPPSCSLVLKSTIQRRPSATNVRSRRTCSSAAPERSVSRELRASFLVRPEHPAAVPIGERAHNAATTRSAALARSAASTPSSSSSRANAGFDSATRCGLQRSSPCSAMRCK